MNQFFTRLKSGFVSHVIIVFVLYIIFSIVFVTSFYRTFISTDFEGEIHEYENLKTSLLKLNIYEFKLTNELVFLSNSAFPEFENVHSINQQWVKSLEAFKVSLQSSKLSKDVLSSFSEYIKNLDFKVRIIDEYLKEYESFKVVDEVFPIAKKDLLSVVRDAEIYEADHYRSLVNQIYVEVRQFLQVLDSDRAEMILLNVDRYQSNLNELEKNIVGLDFFIEQAKLLVNTRLKSNNLLSDITSISYTNDYSDLLNELDYLERDNTVSKWQNDSLFFIFSLIGFCIISLSVFVWLIFNSRVSTSNVDRINVIPVKTSRSKDVVISKNNIIDVNVISKKIPDANFAKNKHYDSASCVSADEKISDDPIEEMATIFTHQFRGPLARIKDNVEYFRPVLKTIHQAFDKLEKIEGFSDLPDDITKIILSKNVDEFPFAIDEINDAVSMSMELLSNIKALAGKKNVSRVSLNVNDIVKKSIAIRKQKLKSCGKFKLTLDNTDGRISGVSIDIVNAISYLIDNAIDAVEQDNSGKGFIEISTSVQNKVAKILVRDNGVGLQKTAAKRMYEPFYSSKKSANRLGVGLTLAKQNVERHGGKINIVPGIDSGTLARISFTLIEPSDFSQYIVSGDDDISKKSMKKYRKPSVKKNKSLEKPVIALS